MAENIGKITARKKDAIPSRRSSAKENHQDTEIPLGEQQVPSDGPEESNSSKPQSLSKTAAPVNYESIFLKHTNTSMQWLRLKAVRKAVKTLVLSGR